MSHSELGLTHKETVMNIAKDHVVSFHFTLKNDKGEVLESSNGQEPLVYLHGAKNIVPGLEEALTGKTKGDKLQVVLPPEKAYGQRDERLVQKVPRSEFPEPDKLQPGLQFQATHPDGVMVFTVISVDQNEVVVDGNPELAGQSLHFDIEVIDVRAATQEELDHGHVHGPGGHHHG